MSRRARAVLLLCSAVLAAWGAWAGGRRRAGRCAFDGRRILSSNRRADVSAGGREYAFDSIRCAVLWLGSREGVEARVTVRDEIRGTPIDPEVAYFVAVPRAGGGEDWHAFQRRIDAMRFIEAHGGELAASPFD